MDAGRDVRVVVAMLTYRRPDDVRVSVPAFLAEAGGDAEVLVIDNDPDASARDWVASLQDRRLRYVHEPRPGIAAGRNRALTEASDADLLVFVDDDERPQPGWLDALLACWRETGAAVVVGAVVSEFDAEPAAWVREGRFFDRRRMPTGTPVDVAATNNLLLDLGVVRRLGVTFDERFGLSGGSDTLFTRTLHRRGARMVWCDEAVVVDRVPADRATVGWVLARARRSGNSASRAELAASPGRRDRVMVRGRYLARGMARVGGGTLRVLGGSLRRSEVRVLIGRRNVQRGLGMVGGAFGHVVVEYGRSERTQPV